MKKTAVCLGLLLLSGCGAAEIPQEEGKLTIVTSFYPIYLLAQEAAQDAEGIALYNMAQPQTGCLHDYEMTIADRRLLEQADILLINGGGMESFLEEAMAQYPDLEIVDTSAGISLLEETAQHHHEEESPEEHAAHEHDHAHAHAEGNPHIWLSPARAALQVEHIAAAFSEADAAESEIFAANAAAFRLEAEALLAEAEGLSPAAGQFAAIFHEGFAYLTELFYMEPAVEIFADEYQEPSAKELAEAAEEAKRHEIHYFLAAEDTGAKYGAILAAEAGEACIRLDPLTTELEGNPSYKERMQRNIEAIGAYGREAAQ